MDLDVAAMRKPYKDAQETFDVDHLVSKNPFTQFDHWFKEACKAEGILEPNAMALATADSKGKPSVRMVLMKGYDQRGFRFFTNYNSRKAKEIEETNHLCLLFYWTSTNPDNYWTRQVRIEGTVEKLSVEESTDYFHSRPKSSQIGAALSNQSQVVAGRHILNERNEQLKVEYAEKEVPKPEHWGGYLVKPHLMEFWQGQTNRIHDRLVFRKQQSDEEIDHNVTHIAEAGWVIERLEP